MRPIKFRYVYKDLNGGIIIYHFTLKQIEAGNVWETLDCCGSHGYELLSIDQSTGLLDKNGKEIYEGDIIKYSGNSRYWTVYWDEVGGQFRFKCYGFVSRSYGDYAFHSVLEYRIVGNIYENPELINQ